MRLSITDIQRFPKWVSSALQPAVRTSHLSVSRADVTRIVQNSMEGACLEARTDRYQSHSGLLSVLCEDRI